MQNEGFHTHNIHNMRIIPGRQTIAYTTHDNDAWVKYNNWRAGFGFGDGGLTQVDAGNPNLILMARHQHYAALTSADGNPVPGASLQTGMTLTNDPAIQEGEILFIQIIQTLRNEFLAYPLLDVVMIAHLPLQYKVGDDFVNVDGVLGAPNPGGNPVLIRNRAFASNPDANTSRFQGWEIVANNLPINTKGFWVTGGHANPVFYLYADENQTINLYKYVGGAWLRLNLNGIISSGVRGPAFINPYDPDHLFVLTNIGIMESNDGGISFHPETELTRLITENSKFLLRETYSGYNSTDVVDAARAGNMSIVSHLDFYRDDPRQVVACSPVSGVFYRNTDGNWKNLTSLLPRPLSPISTVAIDCQAIYVAAEGRGVLKISGYRNA
jgi:hypothetical protein